jgi:branched-chain amino acid transport system ATP-binding protein
VSINRVLHGTGIGDQLIEVIEAAAAAHIRRSEGVSVLVEQEIERALEISARAYLLGDGRVVLAGITDELRRSAEVRRSVLGL